MAVGEEGELLLPPGGGHPCVTSPVLMVVRKGIFSSAGGMMASRGIGR